VLGLTAMNVLAPGRGLDDAVKQRLLETYRGATEGAMGCRAGRSASTCWSRSSAQPGPGGGERRHARRDLLSLMIGVALTMLPEEKAEPMTRWLDSLGHITVAIIDLVMKVAPVGVSV